MTKRTGRSLLIVAALFATTTMAQTDDTRVSLTAQGNGIARGGLGEGMLTHNEYDALITSGSRDKTGPAGNREKITAMTSSSPNTDFWFYDVDVQLFSDRDRDGYFHGIDLLFDADTVYAVADVYAVIYLSYEYGPWNEYAETEDFTIFGTSGTDEYIVETELVSGYPTGNYDILIELYDAWDNTFVASIGPEDTSELSLLPLEDANRDAPAGGTTQVIVNSGGGGSLSWLLLFVLLATRMTVRPHAARLSK